MKAMIILFALLLVSCASARPGKDAPVCTKQQKLLVHEVQAL
jgi:hypothetical protein